MKSYLPVLLMDSRVRNGQMGSDDSYGLAGAFRLTTPQGEGLVVVSSGPAGPDNDTGWEHVSVSAEKRTPTWEEMVFAKDLFWDKHEMCVQYHPPESEYVNFHPFVLHIWRPVSMTIPMPPVLLVGPKTR
jgi:hypothetical protein